ncbi:hypothetical protein [Burkholderia cepacia]|uniref:hypothetical protein n=1 Tax=Burkholderia TaxID=32008 RepID=UPI000ACD36E7|nr:hypothetical protein [Burkholderia cepacia]
MLKRIHPDSLFSMIEGTDYARPAARMAPVASTSPVKPDRALRMPCRAAGAQTR